MGEYLVCYPPRPASNSPPPPLLGVEAEVFVAVDPEGCPYHRQRWGRVVCWGWGVGLVARDLEFLLVDYYASPSPRNILYTVSEGKEVTLEVRTEFPSCKEKI